jgi:hypothetical protein
MYFVFNFLLFCIYSIEKKQKTKKSKKKKKKQKTTPTAASKGGRLKETAVSTDGSCVPTCRHCYNSTAS